MNDPALLSSDTKVPPCPWNTVMIDCAMVLTFSGSSAWNTGRKPPMSASRSSAGSVRSNGMVAPAGSTVLLSPRRSST